MKILEQMLTETIIPFWMRLRDNPYGGYYGYVSYDLQTDKRADKGCILNSRILWFFSRAYLLLKRDELLGEARHAYDFLVRHCLDAENGGVYWSVHHDGTVSDDTKHTYNQAFAVYALAAYYEASRDANALEHAMRLFRLIEGKCTDAVGYGEAYDRRFTPRSNEKLSENGVMADKTMNTLLHVFEAYSGLYQANRDPDVAGKMKRILRIVREKVFNPVKNRQEVFFDRDMNSLIDLTSYGHDIEASWLLDWGHSLLEDNEQEITDITTRLARNVYQRAYHNNSLWNECENGREDKRRVWWVQAEAAVGFMNEYQKHGQPEYLEAVHGVLGYIQTYMVDKRPGSEWFWEVGDDGRPSAGKPIVEPWKCPYHNGRMCFELMRRNADATP